MSFGKLEHRIRLIQPVVATDAAGFQERTDMVVTSARASIELRHATAAWVNRAAYSQATALFRIRVIPRVTVTTDMEIDCHLGRFLIDSVEVLAGKYVEILAHNKTPEGKPHAVTTPGGSDGESND